MYNQSWVMWLYNIASGISVFWDIPVIVSIVFFVVTIHIQILFVTYISITVYRLWLETFI